MDHSRDPKLIAVSLAEFETRCAERKLEIPSHADLTRNLKTSKSRRFLRTGTVNSRSAKGSKHCWIFEKTTPPATRP